MTALTETKLYRTRLDLELDDWLDPSLPANLPCEPEEKPCYEFSIGNDFTPQNQAFNNTPLLPPFTPVMEPSGVIRLLPR
jgi:hypothetical protein